MNLEELQESLEDVLEAGNFSIETDAQGQIVIMTGLREDDDGELVHFESDEDEDDDLEVDPDFEPLADEDDDLE